MILREASYTSTSDYQSIIRGVARMSDENLQNCLNMRKYLKRLFNPELTDKVKMGNI
jgi:hypothetical protein